MQVEEKVGRGRTFVGLALVALLVLAFLGIFALSINTQRSSTAAGSAQTQKLIDLLTNENMQLQNQLAARGLTTNGTLGLDPVAIYRDTSKSVVTVQGTQLSASGNASVLGSGFVTSVLGANYIVTNFHVVQNDTGVITVTFSDGDAFPAHVVGTDPYSDLAVLNTTAPQSELHPLQITSSAAISVGQPVIAIGNPFGLSGSETFGIISQLGRTISESLAGNFPIADVIQFSAPINPGNSGGPLISANGTVIGITTATVQSSQGLGFAIPSDTILRELPSLIATGTFDLHPYLGIETVDMDYQLAGLEKTNVTYGVLVEAVVNGGPANQAGLAAGPTTVDLNGNPFTIGGDIIVSINGTKIVNTDALSSYLEQNCLPGETIVLGIIRGGQPTTLSVVLGTRPLPPS